jgi:type II secretory pathway component PulF
MATMMKAGVPLLQSFDIIGEGFDNPAMRALVDEVKQDVAAGNSFAAALRKKPSISMSCTAIWWTPANRPGAGYAAGTGGDL